MVLYHLGDNVAADAQLPAEGLEPLRVALPLVAEVEIMACHQVHRPMLPRQIIGDEFPPGHVHHPLVKVGHNDLSDTVEPPHQLRPVQGRAEQGDRRGF